MMNKTKGYVLTYINPDTDGVCSALGYAYLAFLHEKVYAPVVFGVLNRETTFLLKHFAVESPRLNQEITLDSPLVLVDTHHVDQLLPNLPLHNVLEVIDHHPGGNPEAFPNAEIQNERVGAAATLITERFQKAACNPWPELAALLAAAIISNTLNFTAPSTDERDRAAFHWLQKRKKLDTSLIQAMFEARSNFSDETTLHILTSDLKLFTINNTRIAIAQLEMIDPMEVIVRADMYDTLMELKYRLGVQHCIFNGVNIVKRVSTVVAVTDETKTLLAKALGAKFTGCTAQFSQILLRKTDFIPALEAVLKAEK